MKFSTLLIAAAVGGYLWWQSQQASAATTAANALSLVPVPAGAVTIASAGGKALLLDPQGNYYVQQGTTPYVLPITAANAKSLLITLI